MTTLEGGDLVIWVTVEPLCGIIETNIRLCISDTVIKNKTKQSCHYRWETEAWRGELASSTECVHVGPDESSGSQPLHPRASPAGTLPLC